LQQQINSKEKNVSSSNSKGLILGIVLVIVSIVFISNFNKKVEEQAKKEWKQEVAYLKAHQNINK